MEHIPMFVLITGSNSIRTMYAKSLVSQAHWVGLKCTWANRICDSSNCPMTFFRIVYWQASIWARAAMMASFHWNVKLIVSDQVQLYRFIFDNIYSFHIACGNKQTEATRIYGGVQAGDNEWPTLALAISENSTVRCTSTIGKLFWIMSSHRTHLFRISLISCICIFYVQSLRNGCLLAIRVLLVKLNLWMHAKTRSLGHCMRAAAASMKAICIGRIHNKSILPTFIHIHRYVLISRWMFMWNKSFFLYQIGQIQAIPIFGWCSVAGIGTTTDIRGKCCIGLFVGKRYRTIAIVHGCRMGSQ